MVAESLAVIVAAIIAYLQELKEDGRITEQERRAARLALSKAFHTTEGYYAGLEGGGTKDLVREHEIAELWDAAAICIEPFNGRLANRLGLKARFWREGAAWTREQIVDAGIQLEKVRRDGNYALIK